MFHCMYRLKRVLHEYSWKSSLREFKFVLKRQDTNLFLSKCDFSYVSYLCVEVANDQELQYFHGIPRLWLSPLTDETHVTDEGLQHLKGVQSLTLYGFSKIGNTGMEYLRGIHMLQLWECPGITREGLECLSGLKYFDSYRSDIFKKDQDLAIFCGSLKRIQHLSLSCCDFITDQGLAYLQGIPSLDLSSCFRITDNGLKYLSGVQALSLFGCKHISDHGLACLRGILYLSLGGWTNSILLTDDGLKHLNGLLHLNLSDCDMITDEGLLHLKGIESLSLTYCHSITEKGLKELKGIRNLFVQHCNHLESRVTGDGLHTSESVFPFRRKGTMSRNNSLDKIQFF